MGRPQSWVTCLCCLLGGTGLSTPWLPVPQCQPCSSSGLSLSPSSLVGGRNQWKGGPGTWFYTVTTVGRRGGVPCISVKYLIYLNINKIKLFVKFSVLCCCSGSRAGSESAEPGVEAASCLKAGRTSVVCGQRTSSAFLPAAVKLQCLLRA